MTNDKFKQCYTRSKADAKRRGIEFLFTFDEWKSWWLETGRWELRGKKAGCYQMCRKNDVGPYAVWNVYCDTVEANSRLPHAGTKRPPEWVEKIGNALRGKVKSPSHAKALAAAHLGKRYKTQREFLTLLLSVRRQQASSGQLSCGVVRITFRANGHTHKDHDHGSTG